MRQRSHGSHVIQTNARLLKCSTDSAATHFLAVLDVSFGDMNSVPHVPMKPITPSDARCHNPRREAPMTGAPSSLHSISSPISHTLFVEYVLIPYEHYIFQSDQESQKQKNSGC